MSDTIKGSYQNITAWKKGFRLSVSIYKLSQSFPPDERFGLTSQMRRSSVSIPSNIAEGYARGSKKEFHHFLRIAYASGAEPETQIALAKEIFDYPLSAYQETDTLLQEVMKMLNTMLYSDH
ncbi:MAG: four helix bundle protein [Candidatus Yonathbacteria bacterium]|nr:four helix bundle protein [Candidatus Yonathbacteria bacterium]NTW48091.1 four helix bundle protein [Candidatus Yonathbacteria bacterium]